MFKLFTNNRINSSIHFDNYNFRYFRTNTNLGDIAWRCIQKTNYETYIYIIFRCTTCTRLLNEHTTVSKKKKSYPFGSCLHVQSF